MCALFPCPLLQFPPCIISSDVAHPPPPQCSRGQSFQPLTAAHALLYGKIAAFVQDMMSLGTLVPGRTQGPFSTPQSLDCHSDNSPPPLPSPGQTHNYLSLFFSTVVINWFFYSISAEFGSCAFLPHNWHSYCSQPQAILRNVLELE